MSSEPSDAPGAASAGVGLSPAEEWSADQSQQKPSADTRTWPVKVWNADQSKKKSLAVTPRCTLSEFLGMGMHICIDPIVWAATNVIKATPTIVGEASKVKTS